MTLSAGRDSEDSRHTLSPAAVSLARASFAPGSGSAPNRSTPPEMTARRQGSRPGPDFILREQSSHDVGGRPAAGPVELNHRPGVSRGASDHALGGDRFRERPLQHVAVDSGRPKHVTADQRYGQGVAHRLASLVPDRFFPRFPGLWLSEPGPPAAGQSSSAAVASVHRSSSARSDWTLRHTANAPSPSAASTISFFTARNPPTRQDQNGQWKQIPPTAGVGQLSKAFRCGRRSRTARPRPAMISTIRYCWLRSDLWGYVDLNHGPRPYQGRALTD